MAIVQLVNRTGVLQTAAANIPNNAVGGSIIITGPSVADATVRLSSLLDFSPDGGATWASTSPSPATDPYPRVATYSGGSTNRDGSAQTQFDIAGSFPPGTNRKIRGTFTFDGNPFNGQADISTF